MVKKQQQQQQHRSRRVFNHNFSPEEFSNFELYIAQVLLELPQLVVRQRFPLSSWGAKRRRSAINVSPSPPHRPHQNKDGSFKKSASKGIIFRNIKVKSTYPSSPPLKTDEKIKGEASSPGTPLSFSPSESDYRSKHSKKKSLKKKFEELNGVAYRITTQNLELQEQIKRVRDYRKELEEKNKALKELAIKLEKGNLNSNPILVSRPRPRTRPPTLEEGEIFENCKYPLAQMGQNGRGMRDFDLNFIANEAVPCHYQQPPPSSMDVKNRASEAKKRRYEINEGRNLNFVTEEEANLSEFYQLKNIAAAEARKRRYEINKGRRSMTSFIFPL